MAGLVNKVDSIIANLIAGDRAPIAERHRDPDDLLATHPRRY